MEWILVIYIYAGMLAKGDSVALLNVGSFRTQTECEQAGANHEKLVKGSTKELRFVCTQNYRR